MRGEIRHELVFFFLCVGSMVKNLCSIIISRCIPFFTCVGVAAGAEFLLVGVEKLSIR
jgi:hypothetical protein